MADPARCGAGVIVAAGVAGVDNCREDPNCLTRRIVDFRAPGRIGGDAGEAPGQGVSDYLPVPDDSGDPATGRPPTCRPRPAGTFMPAPDDLPVGRVGMNPDPRAVTGMQSWLWYDGATSRPVTGRSFVGVTADCRTIPAPPPAQVTAAISGWRYDVDDGWPQTYHATRAGSEEHPAARHLYRTKGDWQVQVTCTWTIPGHGHLEIPCATRTVEVIELRTHYVPSD